MKILCVFGRYAYGDPKRGDAYEYVNFLPALAALGHDIQQFDSFDRSNYADFADLNQRFVDHVLLFKPDVIFAVLMNYEIWFETLDLVRKKTPAVIINWGTDDSWKFSQYSRFLARHIDLHVTTDKASAQEAERLGLANVVASQWAASSKQLAAPLPSTQCIWDVSFVGAAYGNRRRWIAALKTHGIDVACFGQGWESGPIASADVSRIYRTSRISLNFGDSELHLSGIGAKRSRQIKARTFEVPGAGGFLLTEGAEDLSDYFDIGTEIVTFANPADLAQRIKHFIAHPGERDRIAQAGHARVARDHIYEGRFSRILREAQDRKAALAERPWTLERRDLSSFVEYHRRGTVMRRIVGAFDLIGRNVLGSKRAQRALRKIAYELSWRLCGEETYRAKGLPGRLFYRES